MLPNSLLFSLPSRNQRVRRLAVQRRPHDRGESDRSHDLDQQLSEVLALKQAEESRGRVFQALDHVFAIFEAAAAHPAAGLAQEIILLGGEIPDDEAAQPEAVTH